MEYRITDLLDELQEVPVDILPYTAASESRIKELTMQKISKHPRRRPRIYGITRKILIAAAILAAMAIPVLAASGILFSDWTPGIEHDKGKDYDNSPVFGAGSMVWEASNWAVRISAEDVTPTGLSLICEELGTPEKSGSLTASDGFWLEQWNGSAYVPMDGNVASDSSSPIAPGAVTTRQLSWEETYGVLPSGSYRLGQSFTFTNTGGETRELTFYAKFRIFSTEMEPYIQKYNAALDKLCRQESSHLILTTYNTSPGIPTFVYDYYIQEIWKNGEEYLIQNRYYDSDGLLYHIKGYMFRDGVGYSLIWASEGTDAAVISWESADFIDEDYLEGWELMYNIIESTLVEVYDNGNTISYVEFFDSLSAEDLDIPEENISPYIDHDYTQRVCTFDESGNLLRVENARRTSMDPENTDIVISRILEVADTTPDEISRIIHSQSLETIPTFSWLSDRSTYSADAYTEDFWNQDVQENPTVTQIIDLARAELKPQRDKDFRDGSVYNMVSVYRDEAEGIWKVVFRDSQRDDVTQIIFLNSKGQTVMIAVP